MDASAREQYVFHYLAMIDMERVRSSLMHLRKVKTIQLQEALFRDAVVTYAKAFTRNRNLLGKKVLRMQPSHVTPDLMSVHDELLELRNTLFAHVDLDRHQLPANFASTLGYCNTYNHLHQPDAIDGGDSGHRFEQRGDGQRDGLQSGTGRWYFGGANLYGARA